jgi:iodotyrosine deiodinase
MQRRARDFREELGTRRSVRDFSSEPIPAGVLEDAIATAASAPSGANMQPWTFVVVRDSALKRRIREAAEEEERRNYDGRMSEEWLGALAPLGTDWRKEFLETAPALIVVFKQEFGISGGKKIRHYYVNESVGIASGFLLAALHHAGLATLTHTPSPMGFLRTILERPPNEKAYLLIPVGYPAEGCRVPSIARKPAEQVAIWL